MYHLLYHLILGSNLGDRADQLDRARQLIRVKAGDILKESSLYETQPWGVEDQPLFLNQALAVKSPLEPDEMLYTIKTIERKTGRLDGEKWNARHIDIDILLCGDRIVETEKLTIPHPLMHQRNFVLVPLMEIAPGAIHPVLQKTIEELFAESRDQGEVYLTPSNDSDDAL